MTQPDHDSTLDRQRIIRTTLKELSHSQKRVGEEVKIRKERTLMYVEFVLSLFHRCARDPFSGPATFLRRLSRGRSIGPRPRFSWCKFVSSFHCILSSPQSSGE